MSKLATVTLVVTRKQVNIAQAVAGKQVTVAKKVVTVTQVTATKKVTAVAQAVGINFVGNFVVLQILVDRERRQIVIALRLTL